ncbi:hypothetical protein pipiens_014051 [Culex pipiens pipiens]|uniref:Uncharacterized protein n=1 Tax=Culex pipiens pipiens TaxID=38569 RepID=A0ABD1CW28_CULPP
MLIDKRQLLTYLEAVANELKKIVALPCYNLTPSPSPPPSLCSPSSPTPSSKRFRWSLDLNRDLMFCYYVVTGGGQNTIGYRSRLQDLWCTRQTSYGHLNEQNLLSQLRRIQRDHLLPEDVLRKVRTEANEYEFDYHCSRSRPLKISDKNRKVFRKMAKNYSRMKELHSINRALSYVNSVVDMKFCASREIDVLAMKRVVQVLVDDITDLISRLEKRTGRSFTALAQDPLFQKAKDYPEKRYDLLRQCLQKHKIAIDSIILQDLKQEDQKLIDAKISQMQALFMDQNMNLRAFDRTEEIAFEMLMLEATWALSSKLLNNAESISGYVPVLTGRNMRNYLAHGGLTYEVLIPNTSSKTILQNALSVMKLSKNIISEIYERHSWSFADRLECLQRQSDTLEGFRIQSCVEILDTIKAEQYLIGQDHLHRGVVDRLVQTQSCLLLGHLLDLRNVDELLKILSHLMEDVKVIPCNVKFHDLLTNLTARIRFCFNLALLTNEEDVLLKIASDFGYDQIEAIPMIFTFDKLFTSFLENHPDYDVNAESNAEVLHYAVLSGNVELLNLLLDQCEDLNQQDAYSQTPLDVACKLSNVDMIKSLTNAAMFDRLDIIRYLINNFPNITPFILAPYVAQNRCLHIAVLKGSLEMVHYFIKLHKDNNFHLNHRNQEGFTALHISAQTGNVRIFQLLLDSGADPSIPLTNKQSILHTAVSNNNLAIARILLTRALIDVNALDDDRRTILHYSVYSRNPSAVRELLKIRGLHMNGQDRVGNSALHLAAEHQYVDIYNLLQKRMDNGLINQDGKRAIDILLRK